MSSRTGCFRCVTPRKCGVHGCCPGTWPAETGDQFPLYGDVRGHVTHALRLAGQVRTANANSEKLRQELRYTLQTLDRFLGDDLGTP